MSAGHRRRARHARRPPRARLGRSVAARSRGGVGMTSTRQAPTRRRASAETSTPWRTSRPNYVDPPIPTDQDVLRERRRTWLRVHYTGSFDLGREVSAITTPLAEQLAALPEP